jgi:hypothetical protein
VVAWLGRFTTEADLSPASYVTHNLRAKINSRGRGKGAALGRVFDDKVRHKPSPLNTAPLSEQACASLCAVDKSEYVCRDFLRE